MLKRMRNRPNLRYRHVYAVVRIDAPLSEPSPENNISVVKVFVSEPDAEKEVARLSEVNADKSCVYTLQTTRLVE